ncbi:MAG: redoxin domain-containing protein [Capsulimonadales bacterium]|nr:redoxin domain-containing protein [Capsulimonadales bacterium]
MNNLRSAPLPLLSVVAIAALAVTCVAAGKPAPSGETAFNWKDLANRSYSTSDIVPGKADVFLFTSMECPIAVKYMPRLLRMNAAYAPKGIRFFLVNANPADDAKSFARWSRERKATLPLVKDDKTALADRLGITMTPEAAVVAPDGTVVYRGRIDDNVEEAKVSRRDLANALDDVLAGRPVKVTRVLPFGCAIFRDRPAGKVAVRSPYTWAKDISPILERNCVTCHRKGDVAPFPLDTYGQAKVWAAAIKQYTTRRIMPPWKAQPGHGEFLDTRYLTDAELRKIAVWADGGAPQGALTDRPPAPKRYAVGDWPLGKPDVVVQPVRPFHLEAEGADVYRNFTLPVDFEQDRYISAFDFKPGNRTIVHHMIAYIDKDGSTAKEMDNRETEPGWSVSGGGSGIRNEDWGDGWAPGMNPRRFTPGLAVRVPKGAKLVLQVHYHKTGKPEQDQSQLALYWAEPPVRQVLHTFPIGNAEFVLKPDVADQVVNADLTLPWNVTLHQILPHMHMLGTEMRVRAILPDGTERKLIHIKDWDFNWQMNYRYREPVRLPKGTRLLLTAKYDNTTRNPRQPSNPPREVRFGEQTNDEMCFAFLGFTIDGMSVRQVSKAP